MGAVSKVSGGKTSGIRQLAHTVGVKKTVTFPFRSVPFERRPLLHVRRSVSVLLARACNYFVGGVLLTCQKLKANSFASIG